MSSKILKKCKIIVNSEFTVDNRGEKISNKTYTFRVDPKGLSIYDEMVIDLMTLANNHMYDYELITFNDMLKAFDQYEILHIGTGHNIEKDCISLL